MRLAAVAVIALIFTAPYPIAAQTRVDISPELGLYTPLVDLADQNGALVRQDGKAMFGARAAVWGPKVGLELSVGYASSGVNDGASAETPGKLWLGTLRLLDRLSNGTAQCTAAEGGCLPALYAAAGLGLISRSGRAWSGISGTSSLGASLAIGYRIPAGAMAVRIEGELFMYSASFTQTGATTSFTQAGISGDTSKFQEDLLLSIQLSIPLAGGSR